RRAVPRGTGHGDAPQTRGRLPASYFANEHGEQAIYDRPRDAILVERHGDRQRRPRGVKGLRTIAPSPATLASLRVTRVMRCAFAVAASNPSITGIGRSALMHPHSSVTARSTGRTRSPKAASTSVSQASSA